LDSGTKLIKTNFTRWLNQSCHERQKDRTYTLFQGDANGVIVITYLIPSVKPPPVQLIPPVAHFALHQPQQLHLRSLHPKKRGTCLKNNNFSSLHISNKNLVIIEGKRNSGYLHRPYPYLYLGL